MKMDYGIWNFKTFLGLIRMQTDYIINALFRYTCLDIILTCIFCVISCFMFCSLTPCATCSPSLPAWWGTSLGLAYLEIVRYGTVIILLYYCFILYNIMILYSFLGVESSSVFFTRKFTRPVCSSVTVVTAGYVVMVRLYGVCMGECYNSLYRMSLYLIIIWY